MLAGLSAAAAAGLAPVKVNAVLMRGVNDHEAAPLPRFCMNRGYQLRFIEQMPLDAQHGWRRTDMIAQVASWLTFARSVAVWRALLRRRRRPCSRLSYPSGAGRG